MTMENGMEQSHQFKKHGAGELLSIVVPAYNEVEVLPVFHQRLTAVLAQLPLAAEVVYVNDGSSDGTLKIMESLRAADPRVVPAFEGFIANRVTHVGSLVQLNGHRRVGRRGV